MPYDRQSASKGGHSDFVRNPDVQAFLSECDYMRPPSESEAKIMASTFTKAPSADPPRLPSYVVASDASKSDTPIDDKLPSTQIGFIKVSHVLIEMDKYADLVDPKTRFVDPFKAADLHRNAAAITFTLPGSNIRFQKAKSVKDGFRRAVFKQLSSDKANGEPNRLILTDTLLALNENSINIAKCPSCGHSNVFDFNINTLDKICPF